MEQIDTLWVNARVLIYKKDDTFQILQNSALGVKNGKIALIASMQDVDTKNAKEIIDAKNMLITPSLIDCHTHLIYAKNRVDEFEKRALGKSYAKIAQEGGGINASIQSTRGVSFEELYDASKKRLEALIREGVTTVEIKSGYGLDTATEIKMLKVAKKLEEDYPVHIEKTFLAAHSVPKEFNNDSDAFIRYVCEEMFEKVANENLATGVDVYCEHLAFSVAQCEKIFQKAREFGLRVKIHAEQFSDIGASKLAARYNALSVDHLEYIKEDSIKEVAFAKSVAVLLPGAYYFLKEKQIPPVKLLRKYHVPMAVATDLNPGTSPLASLHLALNMSFVLFGLTPDEAFLAVTKNAAKALGLEHKKGSLEIGYDADFCLWDCEHPKDFVCQFMPNTLEYSVKGGVRV